MPHYTVEIIQKTTFKDTIFADDEVQLKDIIYDKSQSESLGQADNCTVDFEILARGDLEVIGNIHENPELKGE